MDMARVAGQAQTPTEAGPVDNTPIAVTPPSSAAPAFPHATKSADTASVPAVVATYLARWLADLSALGTAAGETFTAGATSRLGLG
jgi:hypothetical protein